PYTLLRRPRSDYSEALESVAMQDKTILIAHHEQAVRDRYAAALADARHAFVTAGTATDALAAAAETSAPISLALLDLGLTDDPAAFVRSLRHAAGRSL